MAECKHGLEEETCSICRHPELVFITGGGTAYHHLPDCEHLVEGQRLVELRAGTTAPIQLVTVSKAEAIGRRRCRHCFQPSS